jgi:hypothetical protein
MFNSMASRMALLLGAIGLILAQSQLASATVQHCHDWDKVSFCVAVNRWHNASTSSTDLVVTFGYDKPSDIGWQAIGLGNQMIGALIFLTYKVGNGEMVFC